MIRRTLHTSHLQTQCVRYLSTFNRQSWVRIKSAIERHGFATLQMRDHSLDTLRAVANVFGSAQKHIRNTKDGIVDITGDALPASKGQVVSKMEFFPHTDGHYLSGVMRNNETFLSVGPPHLILLQCVQPADSGGSSVLVDAQKILRNIVCHDKAMIQPLFFPEGTSVIRGEHVVVDSPVFKRILPKRYAIRFSYDRDFIMHPKMQRIYDDFSRKYIENEAYRSTHTLGKNQILIIDNHRILHGRTAVIGQRHLRRLWIWDSEQTREMISPIRSDYYESESAPDPLEKFSAYGPAEPERLALARPVLKTGITLSATLDNLLKSHLRKFV